MRKLRQLGFSFALILAHYTSDLHAFYTAPSHRLLLRNTKISVDKKQTHQLGNAGHWYASVRGEYGKARGKSKGNATTGKGNVHEAIRACSQMVSAVIFYVIYGFLFPQVRIFSYINGGISLDVITRTSILAMFIKRCATQVPSKKSTQHIVESLPWGEVSVSKSEVIGTTIAIVAAFILTGLVTPTLLQPALDWLSWHVDLSTAMIDSLGSLCSYAVYALSAIAILKDKHPDFFTNAQTRMSETRHKIFTTSRQSSSPAGVQIDNEFEEGPVRRVENSRGGWITLTLKGDWLLWVVIGYTISEMIEFLVSTGSLMLFGGRSSVGSMLVGNRVASLTEGPASKCIQALSACVLGPIMEELLYRGYLLVSAHKIFNLSLGKSIAISSVIFGLCHGSIGLIMPLFGAWLSMLYLLSGNLLVPILVHMMWNIHPFALQMITYFLQ